MFKLAFRTITCSTNALLYLPLHIGIAFSSIGFLGFVTTLVLLFVNGDYRWGINSQNIIQSFLIISSIILAVGIISLIITIPCLYLQKPHGQYST